MAIVVGGSSWNWFEQSSDSRPTRGRKTSNGGKSGSFLEVSRRGGNYFGRAPISIPPFLPFFFSIRCVVVFVRFLSCSFPETDGSGRSPNCGYRSATLSASSLGKTKGTKLPFRLHFLLFFCVCFISHIVFLDDICSFCCLVVRGRVFFFS